MAPVFVIDASVFLNAFNSYEAGYAESRRLLERLSQGEAASVAPVLLLPEIAGAVARGRNDDVQAREFSAAVGRLPWLRLVSLDRALAREAASVAARQRLRGSDAVYAALTLRVGGTLVSRDREQRERVVPVARALAPEEALAGLSG